MKVSSSIEVAMFAPRTLHITIQSEEEGRALYAIFNHTHNTDLFRNGQDQKVRKELEDFDLSHNDMEDVIANGIIYREFYYPKQPNLKP